MKKSLILVLSGIILLGLISCGGGSSEAPSKLQKVFQPDWYDEVDESGAYVFTYGNATKASKGMAESAAKNKAMLDAALYVEVFVKGMMKDFEQEAGYDNPQVLALTEQVVKSVAKAQFQGMTFPKKDTYQDTETGQFNCWVRAAIPASEVKKGVKDFIRSEEAAYNEFKSTQAFKALDEEVSNY